MKPDIGSILEQWPYEPGQITVRKIRGADGREKLQLRLDLGLLQMELVGRPDGRQPYGFSTVLDYVEGQLTGYSNRHSGDEGFTISERIVRELSDEALMNYHRYLSLYVLEDFEGVVRDTAANLRIFDVVQRYGPTDADKRSLEQYRPYVTMMNTRAKAQQAMSREDYRTAMAIIMSGLAAIKSFFESHNRPDLFRHSNEAAVLRELRKEVSAHLPKDPIRTMERKLRKAVAAERYEDAARLRDEIEQARATRHTQSTEATGE
ncbi:MAG: UvrB/UvrC motif-containing protein [Phycisphaerae bacterium]|nr:UvrB/UvrC motif-containing protein [Phycisphaerae bacterium]